jgi:hypothetical protein
MIVVNPAPTNPVPSKVVKEQPLDICDLNLAYSIFIKPMSNQWGFNEYFGIFIFRLADVSREANGQVGSGIELVI